ISRLQLFTARCPFSRLDYLGWCIQRTQYFVAIHEALYGLQSPVVSTSTARRYVCRYRFAGTGFRYVGRARGSERTLSYPRRSGVSALDLGIHSSEWRWMRLRVRTDYPGCHGARWHTPIR